MDECLHHPTEEDTWPSRSATWATGHLDGIKKGSDDYRYGLGPIAMGGGGGLLSIPLTLLLIEVSSEIMTHPNAGKAVYG